MKSKSGGGEGLGTKLLLYAHNIGTARGGRWGGCTGVGGRTGGGREGGVRKGAFLLQSRLLPLLKGSCKYHIQKMLFVNNQWGPCTVAHSAICLSASRLLNFIHVITQVQNGAIFDLEDTNLFVGEHLSSSCCIPALTALEKVCNSKSFREISVIRVFTL